jgi:hypothetical protein
MDEMGVGWLRGLFSSGAFPRGFVVLGCLRYYFY